MRRLALLVGVVILGTVGNSGISSAQAVDHNVLILGGPTIIPGESLTNNWRFEDRNIVVNSGDIVAWDNTGPDEDAPHTITLVRQSKLPANLREMQECPQSPRDLEAKECQSGNVTWQPQEDSRGRQRH